VSRIDPTDLDAVLARFAVYLRLNDRTEGTITRRAADVRRFMEQQGRTLESVKPQHIRDFLANPDWVANTRGSFRDSMRVFFRWAFEEEHLIPTDPTDGLPSRPVTASTSEPASLSAIKIGLEVADDRVRMMIRLAYVLGLKPMEIAQVRPADLRRGAPGKWDLRVRATSNRTRVIHGLPLSLVREIQAYPAGFIFAGDSQGHISSPYVTRLIGRVMPGGEKPEQIRLAYTRALEETVAARAWSEVAPYHSATNLRVLEAEPRISGSADIRAHLDSLEQSLDDAPGAAIGDCKHLLESLFKIVLAERGQPVGKKNIDLPALYRLVEDALSIDSKIVEDSPKASGGVRKILATLTTTIFGTAEIRNELSDDHGGHQGPTVEQRFARLTFNATVTVAEFVVQAWERVKNQ